MLNIFKILIILGMAQGIAEFLPISSSGHLVILNSIFNNELNFSSHETELFINVALHCATLLAVIIYLAPYIFKIITGLFNSIIKKEFNSPETRTCLNILSASLPAGVIGILFHDHFEKIFSSLTSVFIMLILNGIVLLLTKKIPQNSRKIEEIGFLRSLTIGFFQAAAIMPGISRSGMTIAGGIFTGLAPIEAARFSFLMAIPVISGAGLVEGVKAFQGSFPPNLFMPLGISMLITVIVALISIRILFALVKKVRIDIFGYYTIALGVGGLVYTALF